MSLTVLFLSLFCYTQDLGKPVISIGCVWPDYPPQPRHSLALHKDLSITTYPFCLGCYYGSILKHPVVVIFWKHHLVHNLLATELEG